MVLNRWTVLTFPVRKWLRACECAGVMQSFFKGQIIELEVYKLYHHQFLGIWLYFYRLYWSTELTALTWWWWSIFESKFGAKSDMRALVTFCFLGLYLVAWLRSQPRQHAKKPQKYCVRVIIAYGRAGACNNQPLWYQQWRNGFIRSRDKVHTWR